jgi:hypothetical protein
MGGAFGLTAKIPLSTFTYTDSQPSIEGDGGERQKYQPKIFEAKNGVRREFCENCGAFICEYGEAARDKFR